MATTNPKLRRPGEPQRPRAVPDEELARLRADQLEERRAENAAWLAHLERNDPGSRLAPAQAREVRARQLREIEKSVEESARLDAALEIRERADADNGVTAKLSGACFAKPPSISAARIRRSFSASSRMPIPPAPASGGAGEDSRSRGAAAASRAPRVEEHRRRRPE